jgi:hypothetical protein
MISSDARAYDEESKWIKKLRIEIAGRAFDSDSAAVGPETDGLQPKQAKLDLDSVFGVSSRKSYEFRYPSSIAGVESVS